MRDFISSLSKPVGRRNWSAGFFSLGMRFTPPHWKSKAVKGGPADYRSISKRSYSRFAVRSAGNRVRQSVNSRRPQGGGYRTGAPFDHDLSVRERDVLNCNSAESQYRSAA